MRATVSTTKAGTSDSPSTCSTSCATSSSCCTGRATSTINAITSPTSSPRLRRPSKGIGSGTLAQTPEFGKHARMFIYGKKICVEGPAPRVPETPSPGKGLNPLLLGVILVAVVGVGVLAFWRGNDSPAAPAAAADCQATPPAANAQRGAVPTPVTPAIEANTEVVAKMGPHKQAQPAADSVSRLRAAAAA